MATDADYPTQQIVEMSGADETESRGVDATAEILEKLNDLEILDGVENVQTADPAAYLPFDTHEEAASALSSVGYPSPGSCLTFSSEELVDAVGDLLRKENICVMDMTSALPETASAAYQALTVAGFNAAASCRKDTNAAFLIQKTEKNTPSFLFGSHWGAVQALGKNAAAAHVETKPTPVAYVFFRERQISIPSTVCAVDVNLAARVVAFEITMDASYFSCSMCGTPFITHVGGDMQIAPMATMPDGTMFMRECALKYARGEDGPAETTERSAPLEA